MTDVNVVVVFYSRHGETEKVALAAGVGAIQAHASIRLRRLPDLADAETIGRDSQWTEQRERMSRDYIAPREIDAEWADVIILASPEAAPAEMERYLGSLQNVTGKIAAPLTTDGFPLAAAARAGFMIVALPDQPADRIGAARAHGKRVTEIARKLKA
jgi:hypothetical protein